MDRISQLQEGIDQLAFMMLSAYDYLDSHAPFLELNSRLPTSEHNYNYPGDIEFNESREELVESIMDRVSQNEYIIDNLPRPDEFDEDAEIAELNFLKEESRSYNAELRESVAELEELQELLGSALNYIQAEILEDGFDFDNDSLF